MQINVNLPHPHGVKYMKKLFIASLITLAMLIGLPTANAQTTSGSQTFTLFGGYVSETAGGIVDADTASSAIDTRYTNSVVISIEVDSISGTNPAYWPQLLISCDGSTWDTVGTIDSLETELDVMVIHMTDQATHNWIHPAAALVLLDSAVVGYGGAVGANVAIVHRPILCQYLKLYMHEAVASGDAAFTATATLKGWKRVQFPGL